MAITTIDLAHLSLPISHTKRLNYDQAIYTCVASKCLHISRYLPKRKSMIISMSVSIIT